MSGAESVPVRAHTLGCLLALCLEKVGRKETARELLARLARLIVEHNGVYETYERDEDSDRLEPLRRLLYRSEHPYARGAGLYVTAYHKIVSQ